MRLQVKKEDAEQAKGVLREGGYVPEGEDFKVVDSLFNRLFNKYFGNNKNNQRLIIFFSFMIFGICMLAYLILKIY